MKFCIKLKQTKVRYSRILLVIGFITFFSQLQAQNDKKKLFYGMYFQWGYNGEIYTRSNIHFSMSNGDNFTLHHAKAHNRGDYDGIYKHPAQVSIPQYNYRVGFYLNKKFTHSVEINFDHAKYIVTDGQTAHVTGTIDGVHVDGDSVLNPQTFLHYEHTDGANWLHINYAVQQTVLCNQAKTRPLINLIYKGGAGINIPRTDFTWRGDRLNNNFHIAGYNISAEGGARLFVSKKIFFEGTGKTGFVRYVNALTDTKTTKGNHASQSFGYIEGIVTFGYQFGF